MKIISIDNLSFKYSNDSKLILEDINADIEPGEFVCILGQSGCGKSTLLRLLAGLETPTKGSIFLNDKIIKGPGLERAVVFQDYGLFPWMTAGENIVLALNQKYPGKSKTEYEQKALELLEKVNLNKDVYNKFTKELSGGMQQRCAIARALGLDSEIMLMDEPFGALDAVTRTQLQKLINDIWLKEEVRKTIFFVTHDVDEAILLANRIIVLGQKPGHIIMDKKIEETFFDREYIFDNPKMKLLREELITAINKDIYESVQ